jgi:hypothetical protein
MNDEGRCAQLRGGCGHYYERRPAFFIGAIQFYHQVPCL